MTNKESLMEYIIDQLSYEDSNGMLLGYAIKRRLEEAIKEIEGRIGYDNNETVRIILELLRGKQA